MKVLIMSRNEIEEMAREPFLPNTMLISITDYGYPFARLKYLPSCLLQLQFDDIDSEVFIDELGHKPNEKERVQIENKYHMFTDEQAFEIGKSFFEVRNNIDLIICQCEHGQSRSAAIASAIMEYTKGKAINIFASDKYYPNKYIYQKMYRTLLTDRLFQDIVNEQNKASIAEDLFQGRTIEDFINMCDRLGKKEVLYNEDRFRETLKFSIETRTISPAKLQKKFTIGYGMAAKYCDMIRALLDIACDD